jgi:NTE family protein
MIRSTDSPRQSQRAGSVIERREEIEAPPRPELFEALRRLVDAPERRFILCLGGGSVPGLCGNAALVGLLEELGLRSHVAEIWGTSAGAIVGGAWASGTSAKDIHASIRGLEGGRALDVAWPEVALAFLGRPFGRRLPDALLRGERLHRAIAEAVRVELIEDCEIPFRAIACTDDGTIRRKIFREGPILPAISASMSLPGLLLARDKDRRATTGYYDGGLVERTPLISPISEHARSGDTREPVILATYFSTEARRPETARGFVERFLFTIYGLEDQLWEYHLREARARISGKLLVLTPQIDDPRAFDFKRTEENLLQAREFYKDRLQNGKLGLSLGA